MSRCINVYESNLFSSIGVSLETRPREGEKRIVIKLRPGLEAI